MSKEIIVLNIKDQTNIKVFEKPTAFLDDLNITLHFTVELLIEYLMGFTSLNEQKRKVGIDDLMLFIKECEDKYSEIIKHGFVAEWFTLKVRDILGRSHDITIQIRRTNLLSL